MDIINVLRTGMNMSISRIHVLVCYIYILIFSVQTEKKSWINAKFGLTLTATNSKMSVFITH